jgi:hypothetical protein
MLVVTSVHPTLSIDTWTFASPGFARAGRSVWSSTAPELGGYHWINNRQARKATKSLGRRWRGRESDPT